MASDRDELAQRLLDAQVEFTLGQLTDEDEFRTVAEQEIDSFLTDSGTIPLESVMPRQLIKDVVYKYAVQFPVEGAIPELVGEVAARLYNHDVNSQTSLHDVVDDRQFDELATSIAEMPAAQRALEQVLESPSTVDTVVDLVQRSVANNFGSKAARRLARPIEKVTRYGAGFVLDSAREDPEVMLLDTLRDFWRGNADRDLSGFKGTITDDDIEDFVVIGFEFFRTFRNTPYFRTLLDEGVDEVFDTYGATPIADVLEDLGIERADLMEEAMRFGPPVLAHSERARLPRDHHAPPPRTVLRLTGVCGGRRRLREEVVCTLPAP
ncbi:MAG: hypothetical protein QM774_00600 [Gordonia sp. (in: high G+C Gram-positive bacteria)]|uniref:hypothetical protein n=1 Tax=Gordonia sp. (in: high G+C Gram-positive bacteria) TaxID=84139 RepID=UPI0039E60047